MAKDPILPIRVDADTKARWSDAAARERMSLSEFVRDAVEARIGTEGVAPVRAKGAAKKAAGVCSRERFHRPGVFCKECGTLR